MLSVIEDVNRIESTFLKLELYPNDETNPPENSEFTTDLAANRTIEFCDSGVQFPRGGEAIPDFNGDKVTSCEMKLEELKDLREFILTFGHELGHCLGLDHPQETTNAVMSYYVDRSRSVRYQIDDKMGLTALYPIDSARANEKNGFGASCAKRF